jgi:signal transduction histidine kinase
VQPNRTMVVVVDDTPAARDRLRELLAETEPTFPSSPPGGPSCGDEPLPSDPVVLDDPIVVRMLCEGPLQEAQDAAVRTVTRTMSHELNQPLALLLGLLELRAAGAFGPDQSDELLDELHGATADLAARLERLSRAVRFATRDLAGYEFLDVDRAL